MATEATTPSSPSEPPPQQLPTMKTAHNSRATRRNDAATSTKCLPRRKLWRCARSGSSVASVSAQPASSTMPRDTITSVTQDALVSTSISTANPSLDDNQHRPFPPETPALSDATQTPLPRGSSFSQVFSIKRSSNNSQRKAGFDKMQQLRLILVGNNGVGKSTFLQTLVSGNFRPSNINTNLFAANTACTIIYKGCFIELTIQDTAGQERYRSLTASYYRHAQCCLVFFNVYERESFQEVDNWLNDVSIYGGRGGGLAVVLVGLLHEPPKSRKSRDTQRGGSVAGGGGAAGRSRPGSADSGPGRDAQWGSDGGDCEVTEGHNNRREVALQVSMSPHHHHLHLQHQQQQHSSHHHHHHHHHHYHHHHYHHHHHHHHYEAPAPTASELLSDPISMSRQREIPTEQAEHLAEFWGIPYKEVDTANDYGSVLGAVHTLMDCVLAKSREEARQPVNSILPQSRRGISLSFLLKRDKKRNRRCCIYS